MSVRVYASRRCAAPRWIPLIHSDRGEAYKGRGRLKAAQDSPFGALRRFAKRLLADEGAVRAAVSLDWSNGQVEGQINRLKTIKRQMFGRAGLDLLERRSLLAA